MEAGLSADAACLAVAKHLCADPIHPLRAGGHLVQGLVEPIRSVVWGTTSGGKHRRYFLTLGRLVAELQQANAGNAQAEFSDAPSENSAGKSEFSSCACGPHVPL